jgi:hypothetical protein
MADNSFRTFRRDASARGADPAGQDPASDPLAELARLIGQSDAHGGPGGRDRDFGQPAEAFDDNAPLPELDWAATGGEYAADRAERSYPPPRSAQFDEPQPSDEPAGWPRDRDETDEPASARGVRGYGYGRDDSGHDSDLQDAHYGDARSSRAQPMPYIPPGEAGDLAVGQRGSHAEDQAQDDYEEQAARPRRSGTILVIAVVGLAVLGTAGALGYRAMLGSSMILSLPPIIKPGNTPVKIVPNHDAQAGAPKADAKGTGEQLVTHEEKPVDVQSANPPPHVVTTIPVISNGAGMPSPNSPPPSPAASPPAASPPTTAAPVVPSTLPPGSAQLGNSAQPVGAMDQMTSPTLPPMGSKPVHTVTIRPGQPANAAPPHAVPAQAAHPAIAHQPVTKPAREATPRTAAAGPLSIVPDQEGGAPRPEPRERTASVRSSEPMSLTGRPAEEAAPARAGGYAVQVSAQRSEAEAMASFRSLQAKYPQQLGDRRAMIRRADLGAKGVYYRALVGPFSSAQQATSLCSSLKAAGGTCLIQRD